MPPIRTGIIEQHPHNSFIDIFFYFIEGRGGLLGLPTRYA